MSLWRAELCLTSLKLPAAPNTYPFPTPAKEEVNSVLKTGPLAYPRVKVHLLVRPQNGGTSHLTGHVRAHLAQGSPQEPSPLTSSFISARLKTG